MPLLGEQLLKSHLLPQGELEHVLERQKRTGERLGEILLYERLLSPLQLQQELAVQANTHFVNLSSDPLQENALNPAHLQTYLDYRCIPWRQEGKTLLACVEITQALQDWANATYGTAYTLVLCTERDWAEALLRHFGPELDAATRELLWNHAPELSAKRTFTPAQTLFFLGLLALIPLALWWNASVSWLVALALLNLFYLSTLAFKNLLFFGSLYWHWQHRGRLQPPPEVLAKDWPLYTILVPLYKEAETVPRMIDALRSLDYPKSRLDIKLICEADDEATIAAIKTARPEPYFQIIAVPKSYPRTKPKACNHAMLFARGEYTVIFDAEDRPEPSQLKKAVMQFRSAPADVACLQARLNYYNREENLLARLFAIEYCSLFDYMLPALQALRIPIPLGGTSNHLRTDILRDVMLWDPYNVTEDADLGIRLAQHGYRTEVLDSITLEESPLTLSGWLPQRSRWIKGFMQTWLVAMRRPLHFYKAVHTARAFWGFQFFIGAPALTFLLAPLIWSLCLLWLAGILPQPALPDWLIGMCVFVLGFGTLTHALQALLILRSQGWGGMLVAALLYPFYWLLHSLASYKALWQLLTRPHYWEKTTHALTSLSALDIGHAMGRRER